MLSRIANSLFWMGRYLERVEHMARFAKVQYFSSLDAPMSLKKERVLESMLEITGLPQNYCNLKEDEVLYHISIADSNSFSMLYCLNAARENARGARDTISSELWETINTYYHKLNDFNKTSFDTDEFINIVELILANSAIIKGLIDNTLFHRDERALICEGIHLERSIQISRILLAKLNDIALIEKSNVENAVEIYQWGTLLKSAESFDMCHRFYRKVPNKLNSLEFLLFNFEFPKSLAFNLAQAERHLITIAKTDQVNYSEPLYLLGKLTAEIRFTKLEDVSNDIATFANNKLSAIYTIAAAIENKYLSY
jgi:uncharacterized alpha-E superfamily protein